MNFYLFIDIKVMVKAGNFFLFKQILFLCQVSAHYNVSMSGFRLSIYNFKSQC